MRRDASASSAKPTRRGGTRFLAVSTVLALALVLVPAAVAADRGIVGWFGNDPAGGGNFRGSGAGELSNPEGIDVNDTGAGGVTPGTVYVGEASNRRVQVFGPDGGFVAAWGWNVTGIDEEQQLTVDAQGGEYTLSFGGHTTAPIIHNAGASTVRSRLQELPSIGSGNVSVSGMTPIGGIFGEDQRLRGTVTFVAALGGTDVEQLTANTSELEGENINGGPPLVSIQTLTPGAGGNAVEYEVCTVAAHCAAGANPQPNPPPVGAFGSSGAGDVAVDRDDGSVYVYDQRNRRVQKFSATGTPLLVFGRDVNSTQAGTTTEACPRPGFPADVCKAGTQGSAGGEFAGTGDNGLAVVPAGLPNAGNVVVTDASNRRAQEFTAEGAFVRAFGWDVLPPSSPDNLANDEVQEVMIPAADGTFTLRFGSSTTAPLAFDATAAALEAALNGLSSVSSGGGSVSVGGGPGDATGSSPYVVTFDGGPHVDKDVAEMIVNGRELGAAVGAELPCSAPPAENFTKFQWLRNGQPIAGATSSTYEVAGADEGTLLQCEVFASNDEDGSAMRQTSPVIRVAPQAPTAPPAPPTNLPDVTGTFLPGQNRNVGGDGGWTVHCNTGSWGGSPTFTYQWYRSGVPLSGNGANTANYVVQPKDVESRAFFQCAVTGTNAAGSATRMSRDSGLFSPHDTEPAVETPPGSANASTVEVPDLATVKTTDQGASFEVCTVAAECRAGVTGSAPGQFAASSLAVGPGGEIYAADGQQATLLTPQAGPPALAPSRFGSDQPEPEGTPNTSAGFNYAINGLAIGDSGNVLVAKRYADGHTTLCADGKASAGETRIQEISSDGSSLLALHGTCSARSINDLAWSSATDSIYSTNNQSFAGHRVYVYGDPTEPTVELDEPEPTTTTALLQGRVNPNPSLHPNPAAAFRHIEFKKSSDSAWQVFRVPVNVGNKGGEVEFEVTLTPLLPNTTYDVKLVGVKEFNSVRVETQVRTFTTVPAPPAIHSARSSELSATSARLHATINPRGSATSYYFEFGTTPNFGQQTPGVPIGDGQGAVDVSAQIGPLQDVTYYFRVIATNPAGEVASETQTFAFHPPVCPNAGLRQQTGASYLPDCRAYELVTPARAGNTEFRTYYGPPNSGYATNPSRVSFVGLFSPLPDAGDPPNAMDLYASTRTNSGWVTKIVGFGATEGFWMGGPPGPNFAGFWQKGSLANRTLDRFLQWDLGDPATPQAAVGGSNAPFLFGYDEGLLQRLPTNVNAVAGGKDFGARAEQLHASEDLSHFVFQSNTAVFASGGQPGDVYDNDVINGTIEVVNRDPEGNPFPAHVYDISRDGSRILLGTPPPDICTSGNSCPAVPSAELFMHTDGGVFDVTKGHPAKYAGMPRDGRMVYFVSDEQVTADDTDASSDLFVWRQATDEVSRVSSGDSGAAGNRDSCVAVDGWTPGCGVGLVSDFERACTGLCDQQRKPSFFSMPWELGGGEAGKPGFDHFVAPESGDIYFYSPEKLDGPAKGAGDLVNLYVYRGGEVKHVATLNPDPVCRRERIYFNGNLTGPERCAEGPILRMQVTEDGGFAAFTATSRLTGYDNAGIEVMYRYAPDSDQLICVSCLPNGQSPTLGVNGSQNGLFLTKDGRVFFASEDPIVTQDTNEAEDVYEYVDGRAQLITTGTQPRPALPRTLRARDGLIAVSADGLDVYFATQDTLVPQDENGGNLKVYNARTNGGFQFAPPPPSCAAADECHGPSSAPPPPAVDGTGASLVPGNVRSARQRCGKRRVRRKGRCIKRSVLRKRARRKARAKRRQAQRRRAQQRRRAIRKKQMIRARSAHRRGGKRR